MSWLPKNSQSSTREKSLSDRNRKATAWCAFGPAVFLKVIPLAMNPSPVTPGKQRRHFKTTGIEVSKSSFHLKTKVLGNMGKLNSYKGYLFTSRLTKV